MKLNFDIKNKKIGMEMDSEKLIEKGMEQHERTWKDKFNIKYKAKKEMLEIKHKQKMEIEEKNEKKKNWFQRIEEEKRKTRELELQHELEEKIKQEEERKRILELKMRASVILGILGSILLFTGYFLGSVSEIGTSGWDGLTVIGFFALISIAIIWAGEKKKEKEQVNKKRKNKKSL